MHCCLGVKPFRVHKTLVFTALVDDVHSKLILLHTVPRSGNKPSSHPSSHPCRLVTESNPRHSHDLHECRPQQSSASSQCAMLAMLRFARLNGLCFAGGLLILTENLQFVDKNQPQCGEPNLGSNFRFDAYPFTI